MDNAYYILAKRQIDIERLHICTWEFPNESSYIEFGVEFPDKAFNGEEPLEFFLAVPFVKKDDIVTCLMSSLSDRENSRFIFNDVVNGVENVGTDTREGSILKFETREVLTVLPCNEIVTDEGLITIKIKQPPKHEGNLYFRILVKLSEDTIAIKKSGVAQSNYIYDIKINETRNIPQNIYDIKNEKELQICKIKKLFCLHAVPDSFEFSFVDTSKLKNIRKLESTAFQKYLPNIKSIKKDCYNIMFLKDSVESDEESEVKSYSFFTICTEETIGSKQIALAVAANIICGLLFAISSLRFVKNSSIAWYSQIPWEYWIALIVFSLLLVYLFTPLKKKF